jgi:hypothetical protein
LNFATVNSHFNLHRECAVESVIPKLPPILGMEFRWTVMSMLQKSKSPTSNIHKMELKAMKTLVLNKVIRILPGNKGTAVLDGIEYCSKINALQILGVFENLSINPTDKFERKVQQFLAKYETVFSAEVK